MGVTPCPDPPPPHHHPTWGNCCPCPMTVPVRARHHHKQRSHGHIWRTVHSKWLLAISAGFWIHTDRHRCSCEAHKANKVLHSSINFWLHLLLNGDSVELPLAIAKNLALLHMFPMVHSSALREHFQRSEEWGKKRLGKRMCTGALRTTSHSS